MTDQTNLPVANSSGQGAEKHTKAPNVVLHRTDYGVLADIAQAEFIEKDFKVGTSPVGVLVNEIMAAFISVRDSKDDLFSRLTPEEAVTKMMENVALRISLRNVYTFISANTKSGTARILVPLDKQDVRPMQSQLAFLTELVLARMEEVLYDSEITRYRELAPEIVCTGLGQRPKEIAAPAKAPEEDQSASPATEVVNDVVDNIDSADVDGVKPIDDGEGGVPQDGVIIIAHEGETVDNDKA